MTQLTLTRTDEEVAAAYADAYASGDLDALRDLLAPDVVSRLLMPGDLRTLTGADAFLEELAGAITGVDAARRHSASVVPIGEKFTTRSQLVLEAGGGRYHLAHLEVVTVRDGLVVAIDGVCTGFRPVGERR
ncbi:nuclear transport factor 2 family protein [Nocardioides immobilis]|uniref:Nuclear transport factor 2 family protein n=1 Tax=Nocardioides immobilis TaxID=2049295 RepID=A0A417XVE3_9ACTN|nr:nuclear transport factor 2 family protein [Nocardioides immobilis]RHW24147.1 nuclear transport factor 2 family protein [Nocardioides immobilis]